MLWRGVQHCGYTIHPSLYSSANFQNAERPRRTQSNFRQRSAFLQEAVLSHWLKGKQVNGKPGVMPS